MEKVVGVFNFLFGNASGAQSLARTHVEVLLRAFGRENVIIFALVGQENVDERKDMVVKRVESNFRARLLNMLDGNTGKINQTIIEDIIRVIEREKADILFFDDSIYGNAIKQIKKRCPRIRAVAFYHDIKRYLALEWAKKNPKSIPVQISLITNERKTAKYTDVNIVLNEREKKLFTQYYHKNPEMKLPIILPCPINVEPDDTQEEFQILFVGGYYYPNVNGFRWFVKNVSPLLKKEYNIILVGNKMDQLRSEFACNNHVTVVGRVDDLSPYYRRASLVIGPIFEGAGMKVKTAEALSYGKYFAGTPESLVGYQELADPIMGKSIFLCKTAEDFADVINTHDFSDRFSVDNFNLFMEKFSIDAAVKKMRDLL